MNKDGNLQVAICLIFMFLLSGHALHIPLDSFSDLNCTDPTFSFETNANIRHERSASADSHSAPDTSSKTPNAHHANSSNTTAAPGGHDGQVDRWAPASEVFYITVTLIVASILRVVFKELEHYLIVPYPVVLIVLGCIYGAIRMKHAEVAYFTKLAEASPDTIMLVFFPIMIYEAAYAMQTHLFYKLFPHMLIIGTVGTGLTVTAVAGLSHAILGWGMPIGWIFSALVSACDPVAAIMILREAGAVQKSLNMVLEGTALMSDALAILMYNFFKRDAESIYNITGAVHLDTKGEVAKVLQMTLGGPAWGLCVGFIVTTILSYLTNMWECEVLLIISAPYVTFWLADVSFGVSGAWALVALGLWMSAHRACMTSEVEILVHKFWEVFSVGADALIFSLFGIIMVYKAFGTEEHSTGDHGKLGDSHVEAADWGYLVALSILIFVVRGAVFALLQPVLSRFGMGPKVFTWPNTFVLVWGGFRGGLTLLLGLLAAEGPLFQGPNAKWGGKIALYSCGVVAFGLIVNGTTFKFFLKKLGLLQMPLSKLISINMAMENLAQIRHHELERLAADRHLSDANWKMVDEASELEGHIHVHESGKEAMWAVYYITREAQQLDQSEKMGRQIRQPTPEELREMENIARLRVIKAKRSCYWKQFEEGSVSQRGIEHLEDLADQTLLEDKGIIGADDIKDYLRSERWTAVKSKLASLLAWVNRRKSVSILPPDSEFRRLCFRIVTNPFFELFIYSIVILNLIDTTVDFATTGWDFEYNLTAEVVLYIDLVFVIIYTIEAALKLSAFGIHTYWGKGIMNWNRLDFLILLVSYCDVITALITLSSRGASMSLNSASRALHIIRLVRFFRLFRVLKPLVPHIVQALDERVNSHLFFAYDIARAFMVGQEETDMLIPVLVGYKPLVLKLRQQAETDDKIIARELSFLNEERPDVAAAVKTRQAARGVLNSMHKSIIEMRNKGIIDDEDAEHLRNEVEEKLKNLRHFPHSIPIRNDRDRLWNVPWIHGSREVFEAVKLISREMMFEKGHDILTAEAPPDGIYFLTNGIVSINYPRAHSDHEDLGEIYNSDNLEATFDDSLVDTPLKSDFILAGTMMNVQSSLLDFHRRSNAVCETYCSVLLVDLNSLFKAMATLPAMEVRLWRRVSVCVALNIMIKMGALVDSDTTVDDETVRLSRGAVRLVRPGVKLIGLDVFPEVFLIKGTLIDVTTTLHDTIKAPCKVAETYKEVVVKSGRPAVKEKGAEIYPEYAILLLVPPGDQDISAINIHDSQTMMVVDDDMETEPKPDAAPETKARRTSDAKGVLHAAHQAEKKKTQAAVVEHIDKQIRRGSRFL